MFAIEFCIPNTTEYDTEMTKKIFDTLFENKLLCKLGGRHNSVLIFWTSLIISEKELNDIYDILDKSISIVS